MTKQFTKQITVGPLYRGRKREGWWITKSGDWLCCNIPIQYRYGNLGGGPIWLVITDAPVDGAIRSSYAAESYFEAISVALDEWFPLHWKLSPNRLWWWVEVPNTDSNADAARRNPAPID